MSERKKDVNMTNDEKPSELDRQWVYEANRKHYWKIAIPVFAVAAVVLVVAAVVWVANYAGEIIPAGMPL
jgi:type VI protein secretion system component VasF